MTTIKDIKARQILDSRGFPTVEVDIILENNLIARASVPSGASTGEHEALELRDNDPAYYLGKSVRQACDNITTIIKPVLINHDCEKQIEIDQLMLSLDGTKNKSKLGANAILAVSLACARAGALAQNKPLYQYLAETFSFSTDKYILPVPMMNVLNGGRHADHSTDIQEFMIVPFGADSIKEAVRYGVETFQALKKLLSKNGFQTTVGDEGGFAPSLSSNKEALDLLVKAISDAGYKPGKDIGIALDIASSEFFANGIYDMTREQKTFSSEELISLYEKWISEYPIMSIEDGLQQNGWDNWPVLQELIGDKVMNVGDDFLVTNVDRLQEAIDTKSANAILIKLNQIGSLTETINAIKLAHDNGWKAVISHRSGETDDTFIADLVVATGAGYIKTGSLSRSERVGKYNQLMRIEEEMIEKNINHQYSDFKK